MAKRFSLPTHSIHINTAKIKIIILGNISGNSNKLCENILEMYVNALSTLSDLKKMRANETNPKVKIMLEKILQPDLKPLTDITSIFLRFSLNKTKGRMYRKFINQ